MFLYYNRNLIYSRITSLKPKTRNVITRVLSSYASPPPPPNPFTTKFTIFACCFAAFIAIKQCENPYDSKVYVLYSLEKKK